MSGEQLPKPIHPSQQTLSLEEWIALPIRTPKGERPLRCGNAAETAAAHRKVRRAHALGVIWEHTEGKPREGELLCHKIGNRFHHLQQHLFKTEGRAPAAVQQEAKDAYRASTVPAEDSPEIRAYFERIWGPLKNPSITAVPWQPCDDNRIDVGEFFPEPD